MVAVEGGDVTVVEGESERVGQVLAAAAALAGQGRLVVAGETVRFESKGLLDDATELHERATALAGVAVVAESQVSTDDHRPTSG